jgi:O-antigen/teichoic acid export membrane protein
MFNSSLNLKNRILFSFISNVVRSILVFFNSLALARILGPVDFGRMSFLIATFLSLKGLLDMFTSSAFFTFLSQRSQTKKFVNIYISYLFIQIIIILIILLLCPSSVIDLVWKGENKLLLVLAFLAVFMQNSIWGVVSQMAESQRKTVSAQKIQNAITIVIIFCNFLFWKTGKLNLEIIFISIFINWLIASSIAYKLYTPLEESEYYSRSFYSDLNSVFTQFKNYCLPFVPYVIVSFFYDFLDRWFLQNWSGSKEQGYYSIASQFSAVSLIATISLLKILWKEIAEAHHLQDSARVNYLFNKTNKILYVFGAILSCFFIPWIKEILDFFFGENYKSALIPMTIMFIYPIHQSIGQVIGTMYLALGLSKEYVIIGIIFMVISIFISYLLLAPRTSLFPGLALASSGLAIKMVLMQIISANVYIWWLSKKLKFNFNFLFQFYALIIFLLIGYTSFFFAIYFSPFESFFFKITLGLLFYTTLSLITIFKSNFFIDFKTIIISFKNYIYEKFSNT